MRTLVNLPEEQPRELAEIGKAAGISRADVTSNAVDALPAQWERREIDDAFGIWRDRPEDGLAYQERLRRE